MNSMYSSFCQIISCSKPDNMSTKYINKAHNMHNIVSLQITDFRFHIVRVNYLIDVIIDYQEHYIFSFKFVRKVFI